MRNLNGEKVNFNELIAGKNVIALFLPKIGTSAKFLPDELKNLDGLTGCTNQCKVYENELDKFRSLGYEIFAISSLGVGEMSEFKASLGVSFEFFSDNEFELESLLNLKTLSTSDGKKFYHRQTLVFKNGELINRKEFIAKPEANASEILEIL